MAIFLTLKSPRWTLNLLHCTVTRKKSLCNILSVTVVQPQNAVLSNLLTMWPLQEYGFQGFAFNML